MGDAASNLAAIDLELGFSWPAQSDASDCSGPASAPAGLPRQVRPGPCQSREPVLILGELDLERTFAALGVLSKDVENEGGPVDDPDIFVHHAFQLALVSRRKLVVEDDDVRPGLLR